MQPGEALFLIISSSDGHALFRLSLSSHAVPTPRSLSWTDHISRQHHSECSPLGFRQNLSSEELTVTQLQRLIAEFNKREGAWPTHKYSRLRNKHHFVIMPLIEIHHPIQQIQSQAGSPQPRDFPIRTRLRSSTSPSEPAGGPGPGRMPVPLPP